MGLRLDAQFWGIVVAFTIASTCATLFVIAARAAGMLG